ncbi:MAG: response regulator [Verrucomicrobia bacterium]|nr:response regulator [Verrucomicrobiota bacterium]
MRKILIVEDDQLVASAYRKRFGEAGYTVDWAPDGLEGIKMVGAIKPDVVLLDLLMPRLDGIEVLKYIRTHPDLKNLPVVVFSNSYMTNLVESAWRNGADQCLMKASTTPAQLFDAVDKAMQKAAARMSASTSTSAAPMGTITPLAKPVSGLAPALPAQSLPTPPSRPVTAPFSPPISPLASRPPAQTNSFGTTMTPRPATAAAAPSAPAMPQVDPEFQAQIRQLFLSSAPAKLSSVREAATAFVQDQGSSMQLPLLADLFRRVHSLTGNAAVAGCTAIAHFASTFEAFLQELQQKPKFINQSTVRTVTRSVETIEGLFKISQAGGSDSGKHASVLVVTSDVMSSQTIGMALEKANLESTIANDPAQAIALAGAGTFSAVVMTVNFPGLSGFELCAQMQTQGAFGRTPVLFISDLRDFDAHSNPEVIGENEIMASPYLLIELSLKALTLVEGSRLQRYSEAA